MSFSFYADFADILAAIGVIASLIFLAAQVRRSTNEVKNTHFQSSQALMASYQSRTQDEHLAAIVQRGKRSYPDLSNAEKLAFASWVHDQYGRRRSQKCAKEACKVSQNVTARAQPLGILGQDSVSPDFPPGTHRVGDIAVWR